jgi:hypothetical protein
VAATDIDPVVARLVALIGSVPSIGMVHPEDLMSRTDLRPFTVSTIDGVPTTRAWFVSGPSMTAERATQSTAGGYLRRSWTYTIYGLEGLTGPGPQQVLRRNALAVTDAIDADRTLGDTVHETLPCSWRLLTNRFAWAGIAASWVEITKTVRTLSTP